MKLLLNGGGGGVQTALTNAKLNEIINHEKPLLYVPLAIVEEERYPGCLDWIREELKNVDVPSIEMIKSKEELAAKNLSQYCAIFFGGGNTYKLLSDLKTSGAFEKIKEFIEHDGVVIGGSAGAIIFGYDIDSIAYMDSNDIELTDTLGFNAIGGMSLTAHYTNENEENTRISTDYLLRFSMKSKTIALPEEDTVFVNGSGIEIIGTRPYYIFENGKITKQGDLL